jgi:two-component system nitrate/nitrite response regulator NarL
MSGPVRLLMIDDHALFRDSVARFLAQEPGWIITGVCDSIAQAKDVLKREPVDVILLDYDLGGQLGTELLPGIEEIAPGSRILMVTGGMVPSVIGKLIECGVSGMVLKDSSPQHLVEAIAAVARGEMWWNEATLLAVAAAARDSAAFTERQRRVLALLLDGFSNKELAAQLGVSEASIKATIQELFRKSGVRTRSQLVRIALELSAAGASW